MSNTEYTVIEARIVGGPTWCTQKHVPAADAGLPS